MDKYIGRLLDNRYEILELIGTGGMAVVYKARCHRLNRLVAVKILKDDHMNDEEFRRRFHSESQAVAMLSHPNIVSVYDVSSSITADYIVMELIDGITLKQYMEKKGVLNWKETLHFAIQIAKALEHAHSRGIVHRDIKPHNVMVLKNGSVKVTDFGIARVMSQSNTLTKEALGSVHYISPEQAKGGRVDSRSDIYSLGVVMYEMMSGRPPYDGESPVAVAIKHINGGAPMPSTLNPNIPGGLEQIIMHAMAVEPAERYESTTQMLRDMDEFRKDPGMLFDYNVPPLDEVIRIQKPPLILDVDSPKNTAQKVAERQQAGPSGGRPGGGTGQQRRSGGSQAGQRRTSGSSRTAGAAAAQHRRPPESRQERSSNVATIAIIACSAVMIMAIAIFLVVLLNGNTGPKTELIKVPSLVGQEFNNLEQNPDYIVRLAERNPNKDYPAGQIYDQTPKAGTEVGKGTEIYVYVSTGEETKTKPKGKMPDLTGKDYEQAITLLNELQEGLGIKFSVAKEEQNDDNVAEGKVIKTEPAAGQTVEDGTNVTVYVSLGMELKTGKMPDVLGMTEEDAIEKIKALNMGFDNPEIEYVNDFEVEEGYVIASYPEAKEHIQTGDTITLQISLGPKMEELSSVLNLPKDEALKKLNDDGFKNCSETYAESDKPEGTVIGLRIDGEDMMPGEKIAVNKTIYLVVSTGPAKPKEVTKDVTISLRGAANEDSCTVRITRDGEEVYRTQVGQGETYVTLPDQTASGTVKYMVDIIKDELVMDSWEHEEAFS